MSIPDGKSHAAGPSQKSIIRTAGHPRELAPDTVRQYIRFVKALHRQFLEESTEYRHWGVIPDRNVTPVELASYLLDRVPHLRPKTFINYRSAIVYWLNTLPDIPEVERARRVLHEGVPKEGYKGTKPGAAATLYSSRSSRKRTFKVASFERLVNELERRQERRSDRRTTDRPAELLAWLQAGLATGLRPVEWSNAAWASDAKNGLIVETAKRKMGGYALPHLADTSALPCNKRVVPVAPENQVWVDRHLRSVNQHLALGKPFRAFYNNNRVYLWSVSRSIFGDRGPKFTLYLMRGQYGANRKKAGLNSREVGEEMGCSGNVASTYYGNRQYGHRSVGRGYRQAEMQRNVRRAGPSQMP